MRRELGQELTQEFINPWCEKEEELSGQPQSNLGPEGPYSVENFNVPIIFPKQSIQTLNHELVIV